MATKNKKIKKRPKLSYLKYCFQGDKYGWWILASLLLLMICILKYGVFGGALGNIIFLAMFILALTWSIKGHKEYNHGRSS